jgi:hypothetical protein
MDRTTGETKEEDDGTEFSGRTMLWVSMVLGALSFIPFAILGDVGRGRACFILVAITAVIVMLRWDVHSRIWFKISVVVLFASQLAVIFALPWSDHSYPGVFATRCRGPLSAGLLRGPSRPRTSLRA